MGKESDHFYNKYDLEQSKIKPPGRILPDGIYTLHLTTEATYSSRTYFKKEVLLNFNKKEPEL